MKRRFFLMCAFFLFLTTVAFAQMPGSLTVRVKRTPDSTVSAGPVAGAKVIVVHWTNDGMHPTMVQDRTATTSEIGICTVQLPPGTYDVFVAANELEPSAFRREVKPGGITAIAATLNPEPPNVKPVN
jgi:hypothetical protein